MFSENYYLAGGTAVALYLGHRISGDFELFTRKNIYRYRIRKQLEKTGYTIDYLIYESADQLHLTIDSVNMSFFSFPYKVCAGLWFERTIQLPDLLSLAAMKAFLLGRRATWPDYVDLYFLLRDHFTLKQIIEKADDLFETSFSEKLFRRELSCFNNLDHRQPIKYLVSFPPTHEVQRFLRDQARSH